MNRNEMEPAHQPQGSRMIREDTAGFHEIDPAFEFRRQEVCPPPVDDSSGTTPETDPSHCRQAPPVQRTENRPRPEPAPPGMEKPDRTIGRLLSDLDIVPPVDLGRVFRRYQRQLELGRALIEQGAVDSNHLEDALYEQQLRIEPLGKILIEKGRIDIDQLCTALAGQFNLAYRKLEGFRFEASQKKELTLIVGKNYAEQNLILPLSLEGTRLTLAVFLPEKAASLHELRTVYSFLQMECVLVRPDVFQALFFSLYESLLDPKPVDRVSDAPAIRGKQDSGSAPETDDPKQRGESEASQTVHYLIRYALNADAESIHIEQGFTGPSIRLRVGGVLQMAELPWLEEKLPGLIEPILLTLKRMAGLNTSENRQPQTGIFPVRKAGKQPEPIVDFDIRASFCPAVSGENATLRLFRRSIRDVRLEDLDHSFHVLGPFKKMLDESRGIVLVAGPAGSGKKETLYAAASYRKKPDTKIIAIEETFTGSFPGIVQTQLDHMPGLAAEDLVRSAAGHEPDIVLLDGLKDAEAAAAAFDLASGGIFVLCGMAADDAADALVRLKALGVTVPQISSCLKAVVSQRRVRKICKDCKEKYVPEPAEWKPLFAQYPASTSFFRGKGCSACGFTGYCGGVVLSEFLAIEPVILSALDRGEDAEKIRRIAKDSGLKTLFEDALVKLNRTCLDDLVGTFPKSAPDPPSDVSAGNGPATNAPLAGVAAHPSGLPVRFESIRWDLSSGPSGSGSFGESNAGCIREMFEIYRAAANRSPHAANAVVPETAVVFEDFISSSFNHIRRLYGCSRVRFSIETCGDFPELIATPVRPDAKEC